MANIRYELQVIKEGVYGRDVRDAIYDGLEKVNDDVGSGSGSGSGTGSGGMRPATVVVGTSANGYSSGEVDYLCSGTADDVILNQATAAAASITGGTVIVLPGTYYLTATVTSKVSVLSSGAAFVSGSSLSQGMFLLNGGQLIGASLRKTVGTGTPCVTAKKSSRISDCQIAAASGDTGIQAIDTLSTAAQWNVIIEGCSFTTECQTAIVATDYCIIRSCHITKVRGYGIQLTDIENCVEGNILDLYFSDSQRGIGILVSSRYNNLVDNTVRNTTTGQELVLNTGASQNLVVGNFANITNNSGNSNYIMANLSDAGQGGSGTGAVDSVNGKTGVVVLTASDVGAAGAVHTHSAGDITSGTLSIERGGTGASTAVKAREALGIGMRGICATTAATAAKVVTIGNFPGTALGTMIAVRFTYGNTAASPTLNVSSSGSLSITHNKSAVTADMIPAGWEAVFLCASGTSLAQEWVLLNPYISSGGSGGDYVSKSGDTMTGGLTISSGGLVVGAMSSGAVLGTNSATQGANNTASGNYSHAEGYGTTASSHYCHAEGSYTTASGNYCHAEGYSTTASNTCSHAEGFTNTASGSYSHAEGYGTTASGTSSHAEGHSDTASGNSSHAEGYGTTASGHCSHAEGYYTTAATWNEHTQGQYNVLSTTSATAWTATGNALVIGNGTATSARSNSFRTTNDGKVYAKAAFNSSGADYGEYCEWVDENPQQEERLGYFLTWEGDKVRIATDQDAYILGISTVNSAVIGNSDVSTWNGMYKADLWGRHETETAVTKAGTVICHDEIKDSKGNVIREAWDETVEKDREETRFVLNPDYDPAQPYINRENRPEWVDVGMMGRLWVRDDGTCEVNGYCKSDENGCATKSDTGYRVVKKQDGFVWVMFR